MTLTRDTPTSGQEHTQEQAWRPAQPVPYCSSYFFMQCYRPVPRVMRIISGDLL